MHRPLVTGILFGTSIAISATTASSGCTNARHAEIPASEKTPSVSLSLDDFRGFLSANSSTASGAISDRVTLSRKALGREFLLRAEITASSTLPTPTSFKPKIVSFQLEADGRLALIDRTEPQTPMVLARFLIFASDEEKLSFAPDEGLKALSAWRRDEGATPVATATVGKSFTQVKVLASNRLSIEQRLEAGDGRTADLRFTFSPYRPDPTFLARPTTAEDFRKAGFYEANEGRALRWNTSMPFLVALSPNTPPEAKTPIQEGILYWNSHFGEDRIVITAESTENTMIRVQWVPDESPTTLAYTDLVADPRTGALISATIYIPSILADPGKLARRAALARVTPKSADGKPEGRAFAADFTLEGFSRIDACRLSPIDAFELTRLTGPATAEAAAGFLRAVVAHEMGHALGLRHNFAGSLGAGGGLPTSSVMDYLSFEDTVALGKAIRPIPGEPPAPLPLEYDRKAIGMLYLDEDYGLDSMPPYCGEALLEQFGDCARWDSGPSSIEHQRKRADQLRDGLADELVMAFVATQEPTAAETIQLPLSDLPTSLDARVGAQHAAAPIQDLVKAFAEGTSFFKVRRHLSLGEALGGAEELARADRAYAAAEIERLGGAAKLFEPLPGDFVAKTQAAVQERLAAPEIAARFSEGERAFLAETARKYISRWEQEYTEFELLALKGETIQACTDYQTWLGICGGESKLTDDELTRSFTTLLAARQDHALFSVRGEAPPRLPIFRFDLAVRKTAAELFATPGRAQALDWGLNERSATRAKWEAFVRGVRQWHEGDEPSAALNAWLVENLQVVIP